MNRNENETESFAGNFAASEKTHLFFEVPNSRPIEDRNAQHGSHRYNSLLRASAIRMRSCSLIWA
jgi:hypothetical protein